MRSTSPRSLVVDEHGGAVVGEHGDDPVDLLLRPDVDALGGLGQHQQLRRLDELAGEDAFWALPPLIALIG